MNVFWALVVCVLIQLSDPAPAIDKQVMEASEIDYDASLAHQVYGRRAQYVGRHVARIVRATFHEIRRHTRKGGFWKVEIDRPIGWLVS